ncbi:hypothetical protein GCM10010234_50870 [Streptomyces hawaiiensis]
MAKKPLKAPDAAAGPQYDFFDLLQRLVRSHGNSSLADLVRNTGLYCSRQALHRALVGPKLPSRKLVIELVRCLGCTDAEEKEALHAYDSACADQIDQKRGGRVAVAGSEADRDMFARVLHDLYEAAGRPSMRMIERMARANDPEVPMSVSSLSDWISGRTIPRDPRSVRMLAAVLRKQAERLGLPMEEVVASPTALEGFWRASASRRHLRGERPPLA